MIWSGNPRVLIESPDGKRLWISIRRNPTKGHHVTLTRLDDIRITNLHEAITVPGSRSDYVIYSGRLLTAQLTTTTLLQARLFVVDVHYGISRFGQLRAALHQHRLTTSAVTSPTLWANLSGAFTTSYTIAYWLIHHYCCTLVNGMYMTRPFFLLSAWLVYAGCVLYVLPTFLTTGSAPSWLRDQVAHRTFGSGEACALFRNINTGS